MTSKNLKSTMYKIKLYPDGADEFHHEKVITGETNLENFLSAMNSGRFIRVSNDSDTGEIVLIHPASIEVIKMEKEL